MSPGTEVLEVGPLEIVPDDHIARADGVALFRPAKELRLLTEMARRVERILTPGRSSTGSPGAGH